VLLFILDLPYQAQAAGPNACIQSRSSAKEAGLC
jgi:hypothetical protein